jgi:hypothetical protein
VTAAVTAATDHRGADETSLQPEMLLKCSRCGRWHEVRFDNAHAGETPHAREMLYWFCGTGRYYAGQVGGSSRYLVKRRELP